MLETRDSVEICPSINNHPGGGVWKREWVSGRRIDRDRWIKKREGGREKERDGRGEREREREKYKLNVNQMSGKKLTTT